MIVDEDQYVVEGNAHAHSDSIVRLYTSSNILFSVLIKLKESILIICYLKSHIGLKFLRFFSVLLPCLQSR